MNPKTPDDYPRELSLTKLGGKWVLAIDAPDLRGRVESSDHKPLEDIATAYLAMREEARRP
jgi:hypothetical protein